MAKHTPTYPEGGCCISISESPDRATSPFTLEQSIVFEAYFNKTSDREIAASIACDRLGVPDETRCSRIEAAVGQILIHSIQHRLPQWRSTRGDKLIYGRKYSKSPVGAHVAFVPQHLFTINWANSGPGLFWPESYHLCYVPIHHRYVAIASQDSTDVYGCTDQAMGHFEPRERRLVGAKRILTAHWREQLDSYTQMPWVEVLNEGLVDTKRAERWRQQVWPGEPESYLG
ncbi:MAG: hypothetical protein K2Y31_06370 [Burkholderiales bacterium]|jgi:hypothetical protein|nr:hypothetical protein [Burkholderiales bacterium]